MDDRDAIRQALPGNMSYKDQDAMMQTIARKHNANNKGHKCNVYLNFIECDTCKLHAHLAGNGRDYMIEHNADYSIIRILAII